MKTINISVTDGQREFVDKLVAKLDFANRSELFRSLIRLVKTNPGVISEPKVIQLSPRAIKRYDRIIDDIESGKTPVYSSKNTKDLLDQLYGRKDPVQSKVSKRF